MDEDAEDAEGTRETTIEVVAEVVAPREVPKPVEVKQKPRVEERTTPCLRGETKLRQPWGSGPAVLRRTKGG